MARRRCTRCGEDGPVTELRKFSYAVLCESCWNAEKDWPMPSPETWADGVVVPIPVPKKYAINRRIVLSPEAGKKLLDDLDREVGTPNPALRALLRGKETP